MTPKPRTAVPAPGADPAYVELADPLFPERAWYRWAETGTRAQEALAWWVRGGSFHPYGPPRHECAGWQPGEHKDAPGRLDFRGELNDGMRWSVSYQRVGEPEGRGFSSGYSTAEDAAYGALTMIEEYEREKYEQRLVVGLS